MIPEQSVGKNISIENFGGDKELENADGSESEFGESDSNELLNAAVENGSKDENHASRKRRRLRRRSVTICTANCRYEVLRRVAHRLGMREVSEDSTWNVYWTDLSISVERCKEMKRFQKINHFPGMSEICRKDLLARNLNRMLKLYQDEYSFFPKTWCLPADMAEVVAHSKTRGNKTYILKPDMGCQGRGIIITKSVRDFPVNEKMICQVYITRPFLIDGYKFDLRLYSLITSCDPLRIFVYNDGLVRLATSKYREPTDGNATNMYMHLTNYAVNKQNRSFIVDDELGSKRKISTLNRWFESRAFDLQSIWEAVDDVIVKTIIAAHPMLKHSYNTCFPTHDYTYACFELLGFDILLDENLKPFVLEVNHSPSFHTDSQIDRDVKERLLTDTFQILNLNQCDKGKIMKEDRRRVRERLLKGIYKDQNSSHAEASSRNPLTMQTEWEEQHKGNFRKVYPCEDHEKYDKFFHQNASSLFQDTAASRAREEASRVQREESINKAKQEAARRAGGRLVLEKLRAESPKNRLEKKPSLRRFRELQLNKVLSNSFEPLAISETEEMERIYQLRQREFLVRSYGLIEQIYSYMKKNRALRPEDELKYGKPILSLPFEESNLLNKFSTTKCTDQVPPPKLTVAKGADCVFEEKRRSNRSSSVSVISGFDNNKGLCVRSNEAPISIRPIPSSKWPYQPVTIPTATLPTLLSADVRSTKAQVARSYSNSVKLRQLERRERYVERET